jgi:hypothetical protein
MKNSKNVFCAIALCIILGVPAKAQLRRGSLFTGSNLSYKYDLKPVKMVVYRISPDFGVFVTDNIATVGELFLGGSKNDLTDYKSFSFGGYYSARYYIATDKICPFLFFKVGGYYTKTRSGTDEPSGYETNLFMPGIGIDYFLNEHIAIEGILGYAWGKNNQFNVKNKYSRLNFDVGLQFFFALPPKE